MKNYDVFNGDADGIFSLLQLRSEQPLERELITGVKRDINLLKKIVDEDIKDVTVLDVSMDKNNEALISILNKGANVFYVDHHFPGDIPSHDNLQAVIDTDANVCTSSLVNAYLEGKQIDWAIAGCFGDNLNDTARQLANSSSIRGEDLNAMKQLGIYVNYNGYGSDIDDLHFHPQALYQRLLASKSPLEFIQQSDDFKKLEVGYQQDFDSVKSINAFESSDSVATYILPNESWARRVSGVYANDLANQFPDRGHAILTEKSDGNYLVSVRAPLNNKQGAVDVCRQFDTGGGREAAAGINDLPTEKLSDFISVFSKQYSS